MAVQRIKSNFTHSKAIIDGRYSIVFKYLNECFFILERTYNVECYITRSNMTLNQAD